MNSGQNMEAVVVDRGVIKACEESSNNTPSVDNLREILREFATEQLLEHWNYYTQGSVSHMVDSYKGREWIFSKETINFIHRELESATNAIDRVSLNYLLAYIIEDHLRQHTSSHDDALAAKIQKISKSLPWLDAPVSYSQLTNHLQQESDSARKEVICTVLADIYDEILNPEIQRKITRAQDLAQDLGYQNCLKISELVRQLNIEAWLPYTEVFGQRTQALYDATFSQQCQFHLQKHPQKEPITSANLQSLKHPVKFNAYFDPSLRIPAFEKLLEGLGLSLKSPCGHTITINDKSHAQKVARPTCFPVQVPNDIRISIPDVGGLYSMRTTFHELGHALHYCNMTTERWELQYVGPKALTEAIAIAFELLWLDGEWLEHYDQFIGTYNQAHGTDHPRLDGAIREAVIQNLRYMFLQEGRRVSLCQVPFDVRVYQETCASKGLEGFSNAAALQRFYTERYRTAIGITPNAFLSSKYLVSIDDLLYSVDYSRAFALAGQLHHHLRQNYGRRWFLNPQVGQFLKHELFAQGHYLQGDDLARCLGAPEINFDAFEALITNA